MTLKDLTRRAVLDAIAEYDRVGREQFLAERGFGQGEYLLTHDGRRYDSKAVAGVAHQYATGTPLRAQDFSGGAASVKPALERLGFQVVHVPKQEHAVAAIDDSVGTRVEVDAVGENAGDPEPAGRVSLTG